MRAIFATQGTRAGGMASYACPLLLAKETRVRRASVISVFATAWLVAGCGLGTASPDPEAAADLADRSFVSTSVIKDGEKHSLLEGPLEVSFHYPPDDPDREDRDRDDGAAVLVGWTSGCNHYGLRVEVSANRLLDLEGGHGPEGTAMGCDPAMTEQESWLIDFFTDSPRWELEGRDLTLVSSDVEIELEEGARDSEEPAPASGLGPDGERALLDARS
jgi:hypothetical protein